jgi:Trk K+ transport system NAD-binding subunit
LKFREQFHLEVVLIKKNIFDENKKIRTEVTESNPNYTFNENDSIVVFGKEEFIKKLENIE